MFVPLGNTLLAKRAPKKTCIETTRTDENRTCSARLKKHFPPLFENRCTNVGQKKSGITCEIDKQHLIKQNKKNETSHENWISDKKKSRLG